MNIGSKIKGIRKDMHLTQKAFAEKLYISHHTVSKWENNTNIPTLSDIQLICKVYNVPVTEILDIPVQIMEDPYQKDIMAALYEFQLICNYEELMEKMLSQYLKTLIRVSSDTSEQIKSQIINSVKKAISDLAQKKYIVQTKTEDYNIIQMTHDGLVAAKSCIKLDTSNEEFSFGEYLYENKNAADIYEKLLYNIRHLIKNREIYQFEAEESERFACSRSRIIEMVFGLYDNMKDEDFAWDHIVLWNKRKLSLLAMNRDMEEKLILMLFPKLKSVMKNRNILVS